MASEVGNNISPNPAQQTNTPIFNKKEKIKDLFSVLDQFSQYENLRRQEVESKKLKDSKVKQIISLEQDLIKKLDKVMERAKVMEKANVRKLEPKETYFVFPNQDKFNGVLVDNKPEGPG